MINLRCRSIEALLPGLAEGSLSPSEQQRCRAHLSSCAACRHTAEELRALPGVLASWRVEEPELPSGEAAVGWILQRRQATRTGTPRWMTRALAAGFAAAALALLLSNRGSHETGHVRRPEPHQQVRGPAGSRPSPGQRGVKAASRPGPVQARGLTETVGSRSVQAAAERPRRPVRVASVPRARNWPARPSRRPRLATVGARPRPGKAPVQTPSGGTGLKETLVPGSLSEAPVLYIVDDFEWGRKVATLPASRAPGLTDGAGTEGPLK